MKLVLVEVSNHEAFLSADIWIKQYLTTYVYNLQTKQDLFMPVAFTEARRT